MKAVGMIVAMRQEMTPLLTLVGNISRGAANPRLRRGGLGGRPACRFSLGGAQCILVLCGVGLPRARAAARALIEEERPELLVSFGVGGGVQDDLEVADVVVAGKAALLEHDAPTHLLDLFRPSASALSAATRALAGSGASLFDGTTVTTGGSQAIHLDARELPHPVLEMETHGVAQAAREAGVPLLAVRALSDSVREPLPFDLSQFTDSAYSFHASKLAGYLLRHPGVLPRLLKLQANTARAAGTAAAAVFAILQEICALAD